MRETKTNMRKAHIRTDYFFFIYTLQLKDYGKTDWEWSMFDPESKQRRHETVFPKECRRVCEMGAKLVQN